MQVTHFERNKHIYRYTPLINGADSFTFLFCDDFKACDQFLTSKGRQEDDFDNEAYAAHTVALQTAGSHYIVVTMPDIENLKKRRKNRFEETSLIRTLLHEAVHVNQFVCNALCNIQSIEDEAYAIEGIFIGLLDCLNFITDKEGK